MNEFIKIFKEVILMPKIIENVRGLLLAEAQKQIEENGYENVTIRSIAKGCSIGLGTFYNYFKSKDMLIATFLLEDWQQRMAKVSKESEGKSTPMDVIESINRELTEFIQSHENIFASPNAVKAFHSSVGDKHKLLRSQLAAPILNACILGEYENPVFLADFAAEALLTWTVAKKNYDEIASVIQKLFVK